jgi:hypothetical protein
VVPSDLLRCTIVFNVLCKKNQCVVEICWPMWIWSLTPSLITSGEAWLPITFAGVSHPGRFTVSGSIRSIKMYGWG